jgi:hypothetical protein
MALILLAVAERDEGWLWMRWAGARWLGVTVAPWMAGAVRTSMTGAGWWATGWHAREGPWLCACDPYVPRSWSE